MRQQDKVVMLAAVVATLGFGGMQAHAQKASPFNGTWKLNAAMSKSTSGPPPPKEETVWFEQTGNHLVWTMSGTGTDGRTLKAKVTFPLKGGKGVRPDSPWKEISSRLVSSHVLEINETKGGHDTLHLRYVVSKDGKTMRLTLRGTTSLGQRIRTDEVFEKH